MTLTDAQRKLLVESLNSTGSTESENGRYARDVMRNPTAEAHFYAKADQARELAELIEGAESVTVTPPEPEQDLVAAYHELFGCDKELS